MSTKETIKILTEACQQFLEDFDPDDTSFDNEPMDIDTVTPSTNTMSNEDLLDQLNMIYTPILVKNSLSADVNDKVLEACSIESEYIMEHNIIKFDDDTQRAQLLSLCSLLIARQANSPDYQAYKQAANVRKAMKIKIQKDNMAAAKALADQYLKQAATNASSPVVRQAAEDLAKDNDVLG